MSENNDMEKSLAEATLLKRKRTRQFISSGIRELDEMLGGGFLPSTATLFQQDLGSGGEIIFSTILEEQLSLSNVVLVILSDPTSTFLTNAIEKIQKEEISKNLIFLNLVEKSKKNINIIMDKHEISLKIRDARTNALNLLKERRKEEDDDEIQLFVLTVSLNPFILNLSEQNVIRILYDNLLQCTEQDSIDLMLLNKNILSMEMRARIQSLCHGIIDLKSYFKGIQKKNEIRILKMIGQYYDLKIEPYVISFEEKTESFKFNIKSAFLTSFETFRNLLIWNKGTITLSGLPYTIIPQGFLNNLLEMPVNIDKSKGKEEILEKAQGIGRRMAIMVEKLYFVEGFDLLKATLQTASLLGWGHSSLMDFEPEENLVTLRHNFHKEINEKLYFTFLEGYYKGIVKRVLNRGLRYVKITNDSDSSKDEAPYSFKIVIRLTRLSDLIETNGSL